MQQGIQVTAHEAIPDHNNKDKLHVDLHTAYVRHQERREAIKQSKLLIKLALELQKHRGCTLAILSGDHFFAAQLHSIQREITVLFQQIQGTKEGGRANADDDQSALLKEWVLLRQHWPKDTPHENFLHHSNLIAKLHHYIWQTCGGPIINELDASSDQLCRFFLKDWLDMIETCAQARGLATHSAVVGSLSSEIHSRIRFLSNQMQSRHAGFLTLLDSLEQKHVESLRERMARTDYQAHQHAFLQAIKEGLSSRKLADADWLYRLGSQSVSACQQVLWCALQQLEYSLPNSLSDWVSGDLIPDAADVSIPLRSETTVVSDVGLTEDQPKPSSTILPMAAPSSSS